MVTDRVHHHSPMFSGFGSESVERIAESFLGPLQREHFATRYYVAVPYAPAEYFSASRQCCQHEVGQVQIFEQGKQVSGFLYVLSHPEVSRMLHQRQSAHQIHQFGTYGAIFYVRVSKRIALPWYTVLFASLTVECPEGTLIKNCTRVLKKNSRIATFRTGSPPL